MNFLLKANFLSDYMNCDAYHILIINIINKMICICFILKYSL